MSVKASSLQKVITRKVAWTILVCGLMSCVAPPLAPNPLGPYGLPSVYREHISEFPADWQPFIETSQQCPSLSGVYSLKGSSIAPGGSSNYYIAKPFGNLLEALWLSKNRLSFEKHPKVVGWDDHGPDKVDSNFVSLKINDCKELVSCFSNQGKWVGIIRDRLECSGAVCSFPSNILSQRGFGYIGHNSESHKLWKSKSGDLIYSIQSEEYGVILAPAVPLTIKTLWFAAFPSSSSANVPRECQ